VLDVTGHCEVFTFQLHKHAEKFHFCNYKDTGGTQMLASRQYRPMIYIIIVSVIRSSKECTELLKNQVCKCLALSEII